MCAMKALQLICDAQNSNDFLSFDIFTPQAIDATVDIQGYLIFFDPLVAALLGNREAETWAEEVCNAPIDTAYVMPFHPNRCCANHGYCLDV